MIDEEARALADLLWLGVKVCSLALVLVIAAAVIVDLVA